MACLAISRRSGARDTERCISQWTRKCCHIHCKRAFSSSSPRRRSPLENNDLLDKLVTRVVDSPCKRSNSKRSDKKQSKARDRAAERANDFHQCFRSMYGEDRWERLGSALLGPTKPAALANPFVAGTASADRPSLGRDDAGSGICAGEPLPLVPERIPWVRPLDALWMDEGESRLEPPTPADPSGLLQYYCLDPSSLLPVIALGILGETASSSCTDEEDSTMSILDMCAAPGGKALAIFQALSSSGKIEDGAVVVANEPSRDRQRRLCNILNDYLPPTVLRSSAIVTGLDGVAFGSVGSNAESDHSSLAGVVDPHILPFSHVLCDAPCSGERHLLRNSESFRNWKASSGVKNRKRQRALLQASIAACQKGGTIVYSTCTVDVRENDDVVERILSRRKDLVELMELQFEIGERTEHGWIVLPDHLSCEGLGPLYVAAFRRL